MAILAAIDDNCMAIKEHAWVEGSWTEVYKRADAMGFDIDKLRQDLSLLWKEWIEETRNE